MVGVLDELNKIEANFTASLGLWEHQLKASDGVPPPVFASEAISEASSFLSAHIHIVAAVALQRKDCMNEQVRLLVVVCLRKLQKIQKYQWEAYWAIFSSRFDDHVALAKEYIRQAVTMLTSDVHTMKTVLSNDEWRDSMSPGHHEYYSHEADGRYSTLELLRRDTFSEYRMDQGLLKALANGGLVSMDESVADFGAATGAYVKWMKKSGLFRSVVAFDGTPDVETITKKEVQFANLASLPPTDLLEGGPWDWVLCLEMLEQVPVDLLAKVLFNVVKHAEKGILLSWANARTAGHRVHLKPRTGPEVVHLVTQSAIQANKRVEYDSVKTTMVRSFADDPDFKETLYVFNVK